MSTAPLKITNAQLESLLKGLQALDGITTKEGFTPFKFDDDTLWAIATNTDILTRAATALNIALKSLAKTHGIRDRMQITPQNADAVAEFMDSKDAFMAKGVELSCVVQLSRAKLNVSKNPIPASVLAALMPILCE